MKPHISTRYGVLLLGLAMLSACAQADSNTELDRHPDAVATVAFTADVAAGEKLLSEDKSAPQENMTMTDATPAAPRGPAIPAAELRARILRFIASLKTSEDTAPSHEEEVLGMELGPYPESRSMLLYRGQTTKGWNYGVVVIPGDNESASRTRVSLYPEEVPHGVRPKTCTYDFKAMAADIVALGYKQSPRAFTLSGRTSWGFSKDDIAPRVSSSVGLFVYRADDGTQEGRECVETIDIRYGVFE